MSAVPPRSPAMSRRIQCRFCVGPLESSVVDLGLQPFSNSYVTPGHEGEERLYPLHVKLCGHCGLAQTDYDAPADEIFSQSYAYYSSYSASWVAHAGRYADAMIARFSLSQSSLVVEIASNDGYLLQHFKNRGIPVLGVEPTRGTADVARAKGIPTEVEFFGTRFANTLRANGIAADLIAANNVLAHVPDTLDFVRGFEVLLKEKGVATFEFPHVLRLIEDSQFDTIYHEHYFYLSLTSAEKIFDKAGLVVFDAEELPTHGGSLRLYACRKDAPRQAGPAVRALKAKEAAFGLNGPDGYRGLALRAASIRSETLAFLADARGKGLRVFGYGAAAKGNTFLNYCGITHEQIQAVADANPAKQGTLLPGSHIPVIAPSALLEQKPAYVFILPWNLATEIASQLEPLRAIGTRFVTAIPSLRVF